MNFDLKKSIEILERTPQVYNTLLANLEFGWDTINEGSETWSAYDILGHLIHGEKTDWIPRARIILSDKTDKNFIPFDRFAQFKDSEGKTTEQLLEEFRILRNQNLEELKSWNLNDQLLNKTGIHPNLGEVTLRQLIATWTIHDVGHLHQLSRVMVKHYAEDVGPWAQYSGILKGT